MEYFYRVLGVTDYHISDLDPTISEKRTQEICRELIRRKLPLTWKVAQGTKIETIKNEETIELMAKAGCVFMAFSPETGSPKLLKIMNKPFDHAHGLRMAKKLNEVGIPVQACFLIGIPGEDEEDRRLTMDYVRKLVRAGIDEIAVYMFTPLPGAKLSKYVEGYSHPSQCTRTPTWRKDYKDIRRYRYRLYMTFFLAKSRKPGKILREIAGLASKNFRTKMEMSLAKQLKLYMLYWTPFLFKKLDCEAKLRELANVCATRN
jgi:radical SAM superfamily enzyme YgiQ (UPF0313 family)